MTQRSALQGETIPNTPIPPLLKKKLKFSLENYHSKHPKAVLVLASLYNGMLSESFDSLDLSFYILHAVFHNTHTHTQFQTSKPDSKREKGLWESVEYY